MKPAIIPTLIAAAFLAVSTHAETSYWTGEGEPSGRGSTTNWQLPENYSTGSVPNEYTDLIMNAASLTGENTEGVFISTGAAAVVKSLTIEPDSRAYYFRMYPGSTFTAETLNVFRKGAFRFAGDYYGTDLPTLNFGTVNVGLDNTSDQSILYLGQTRSEYNSGWCPVNANISGDLNVYVLSQVKFNTGLTKSVVDTQNPGTYIGGVINLVGGTGEFVSKNPNIYLSARESSSTSVVDGTISVVSCNGIKGNGIVYGSVVTSQPATNPVGVLHLRNSEDQTFAGWLRDGTEGKLMIIMEGTATQKFSNSYSTLNFSGGVEVRRGTLVFDGRDTYAAQSHGKLTMLGGELSIYSSATNPGGMGFSSMDYAGGTISLVVGNDSAGKIILTDGTINALDTMEGYVEFNLTGNLALLEEGYQKIVDWTEKTSLTNSDFRANSYNSKEAVFDVRDDGLYVSYAAVPEPAAMAAVLGAMALAFAALKRRN